MRSAAICLTVLLAASVAIAAEFAVVAGDEQAVIVYEKDAQGETVKAWQDLAKYLKLSTGRELTAVSERDYDPAEGRPIYVGRCRPVKRAIGYDLYHLDRDGYMVVVEQERVMLAGPAPWSTFWAVCRFLEDYVGVRWLIPGPLGEDVPSHDVIRVPVGKHSYEPAILSRLWSGAHYGGDWSLRQRIHGRYQFHHNLLRVFPPELFDEHPQYFPQHGSMRYRPGPDDHSWQPCMTDPQGVALAADAARRYFEANENAESFSYGINDGRGYCECEQCRAVDRPLPEWHGFSGDRSVLYYTWLNRVAENLERDHPDKMLGCLAYSAVILPPTGMTLHRNIIPYLTSNRADYWDPQFRAQDQEMLDRWSRATHQMGIYDYAYGMGFAIPRIYNHLFQDAIRFAVEHKVRGFYAEVYPNWGLDGHKLYVMSRILWNPDVDVDAITDDWNERMFREAAEPMKRYFARCERAWREQDTGHGRWAYRLAGDPKQFEIFPPDVLEECTGYLEEAAALAESELVRDRIQFFRKTWDVTVLLAGNYWASHEVEELMAADADVTEVAAAMRRMAERIGTVDVDAVMEEKVGDDPIAFHPPKQAWISPLKSGGATRAKRWAAFSIAEQEIKRAAKAGEIDAEALRQAIDATVTELFGEGGTEAYRGIVEQVRAMATKVGTAVRMERPITVDGVLDEDVWERTDVLTDFMRWGEAGQASHATRVRLAHDGASLFIALECEQDTSKLVTNASPRDGSTWKDDSVEVFASPAQGEHEYVQFIINAAGAFFDQWRRTEEQTYGDALSHDFGCDWAATVQEGRWVAEMRVPMTDFGVDPAEQSLLPMNFVRNVQGKPGEISSWFPSIKAHADRMSRGWIVLE